MYPSSVRRWKGTKQNILSFKIPLRTFDNEWSGQYNFLPFSFLLLLLLPHLPTCYYYVRPIANVIITRIFTYQSSALSSLVVAVNAVVNAIRCLAFIIIIVLHPVDQSYVAAVVCVYRWTRPKRLCVSFLWIFSFVVVHRRFVRLFSKKRCWRVGWGSRVYFRINSVEVAALDASIKIDH